MRRSYCLALGVLAVLALAQHSLAAPIVSSFDTGLDGWSMVSSNGTLTWQASGGNTDGFASFADRSDGIGAIKAPPKFLGNLSPYNGGELALDYKVFDLGNKIHRYVPLKVTIYSGSTHYSYTLATPDETWDTLGWQTFAAPLTAAAWNVSPAAWSSVLANVTQLRISVESAVNLARPYDIDGVDNITLRALGDPIPEPATMVILAIGAIGMIYRRKARSQR